MFFFNPCWASSATQVEFRLVLSTFSTHNSWIWKAEKVESSKRKLSTCSNFFWLVVWTYPSEKWWSSSDWIIIPTGEKNKSCSKPPSSFLCWIILQRKMMDPRMDIFSKAVTPSRLSRLSRYFLRVHQGIKSMNTNIHHGEHSQNTCHPFVIPTWIWVCIW